MKILITGGGGLIGQAIAKEHLKNNDEVLIYDIRVNHYNDYSDMAGTDITDMGIYDAIDRYRPDIISHQAASVGVGESQYLIHKYFLNNVDFTAELLSTMTSLKFFPRRIMFAGSMGPYGEGPYSCRTHGIVYPYRHMAGEPICPRCFGSIVSIPITEEHEYHPKSFYAVTKQTQEEMLKVFSEAYHVDVISLRYFSVYGDESNPNNPYTGVLSIIANKIINSPEVSLYEDGKQTRDLISADDVARVHYIMSRIHENNRYFDAYHVATGVSTPIIEIAEEMIHRLDPKKKLVFDGKYRSGDIRHSQARICKLYEKSKWQPEIRLDKAIADYCNFIANNWDRFKKTEDATTIETIKLKSHGLI
jgi:dTDP-L-rhamnose 4-epimerase